MILTDEEIKILSELLDCDYLWDVLIMKHSDAEYDKRFEVAKKIHAEARRFK